MLTPLNEYGKVQFNDEGRHYVVHMGGQYFYCGLDEHDSVIWSDSLQAAEIHCRESAELLCQEYRFASFGPVTVDLHVVA